MMVNLSGADTMKSTFQNSANNFKDDFYGTHYNSVQKFVKTSQSN